ncbi:MAG TPA: hypothetical protein VKD90_10820 [Gemmataceae bacterium]|nr:hypothetical protein [Gemmataceae bacterium]
MKRLIVLVAAVALAVAGCNETKSSGGAAGGPSDPKEQKIKAELDKLPPEDRALAEQQKFCAESTESRLGSMGVPIKLMVKGEPVFICCKGCEDGVMQDQDKALARAKELRAKHGKKE